jgi:O-antigen/teichoic acid export membrane protein
MSAPPTSVAERVRRGGLWSVGGHVANVGIRLGTNLLLAHVLTPATFGVANLGQTVLSGLTMFSDLGLRPYLVQSPRARDPGVANTLWTLQISRGLLIALLTALAGLALWGLQRLGWVDHAIAYGSGQLPGVLLALALIPAIGGFESTRTAESQRNLAVGVLTRLGLYSQLAGVSVLVIAALALRSVWAIPLGGIANVAALALLSHTMLPGARNRLEWHAEVLPEILTFGRWIFLSSAIGFVATSLDRLILGGTVSARELGIYSIAATAVSLVTEGLGRLINDLALPTFSEIQRERPQDLRRIHYRFRKPFEIIAFLCMGGLIACGPSLVHFLYDARYAEAGWMVQVLACSLLAARYRVTTVALLATGDSQSQFLLSLASAISISLTATLGLWWGGMQGFLVGLALAPVLASGAIVMRAQAAGLIRWVDEFRWLPVIAVGYGFGVPFAMLIDWLPRLH